MSRILPVVLLCVTLVSVVSAQAPSPSGAIDARALEIAGSGNVAVRTGRLVGWINRDFVWTATDYRQRTPEQIIERRAGNCADLTKVLARLLDPVEIRYRFVREINVQPASDSRQASAERRIQTGGLRNSVFGLRHNDHVWLEVYDPAGNAWIPADPAVGVVGVGDWISARLVLADRRPPVVAAAVPIVESMLVPIAVLAGPDVRSTYYLVDHVDRAYGGRLGTLPAWGAWRALVAELGPIAGRAFAGETNLHERSELIDRAADAYEALRRQAVAAGVIPQ